MKTILTIGKKEDDMRWYMRIIASVALGTVFLSLEASELTDQEVKIMLIDSGRFMHDSSAAREMFLSARAACGVDTNRFSRILLELAETNEVRVSQRMIRLLGRYGTTSALPFLYGKVSDTTNSVAAIQAILRLDGVNSNSVSVATAFVNNQDADQQSRYDACVAMLKACSQGNVTPAQRAEILNSVMGYSTNVTRYAGLIDAAVIRTDETYRFSKRRLGVLRAVQDLGVNEWQTNFVSTAIRELEAYPEANLPE